MLVRHLHDPDASLCFGGAHCQGAIALIAHALCKKREKDRSIRFRPAIRDRYGLGGVGVVVKKGSHPGAWPLGDVARHRYVIFQNTSSV